MVQTRTYGGFSDTLEVYEDLHPDVQALVDAAGFGQVIRILTVWNGDLPLIWALAERWHDTTNTFHLPLGEMTMTPSDLAALSGLRVGGEPIPFDNRIHTDQAAQQWYLGFAPSIESKLVRYTAMREPALGEPASAMEADQKARCYLLFLFGACIYANKRNLVHLSYLPALRDLRSASRYDWGSACLASCYTFMGLMSRRKGAIAGFWRLWEVQFTLLHRTSIHYLLYLLYLF